MSHFNPGQPYGADAKGDWSPAADFASTLASTARDRHDTQWETVELELETITPVFGGGTVAGEIDALAPFRPRAIKNAIRHWWWLLNRSRFNGNPQALYAEMTMLFGGAATRDGGGGGALRVNVSSPRVSPEDMCSYREYARRIGLLVRETGTAYVDSKLNYVGWPLDLDGGETRYVLLSGQRFTLSLSLRARNDDELADEGLAAKQLAHAVSAWLLFGGVGSRTSRGFGRIRCSHLRGAWTDGFDKHTTHPIQTVWSTTLAKYFPTVSVRVGPATGNAPEQAWFAAIDTFHRFRQARFRPQTSRGYGVPNRAYMPTGDAIRTHTGRKGYADHVYQNDPKSLLRLDKTRTAMPALMFGAPVPFKFIQITSTHAEVRKLGLAEPPEGALNWTERVANGSAPDAMTPVTNRYSSPVIVTVIQIAENSYAPATVLITDCEQQQRDLEWRGSVIQLKGGTTFPLSRGQTWPLSPKAEAAIWSNIPAPRSRDRYNPLVRKPLECSLQRQLVGLAGDANPSKVWLSFFQETQTLMATALSNASGSPTAPRSSPPVSLSADERRRQYAAQQTKRNVGRRRDEGNN